MGSHPTADSESTQGGNLNQLLVAPPTRNYVTYCAPLPPIGKIPTEILREIFRSVAHLSHNDAGNIWNKSNDPLLLVRAASLVCTYWRDVIKSSPFLWANVHVVCRPDMSTEDQETARNFLGQCIYYSQNLPLNIRIDAECAPGILGERCIQFMAANSYKWGELEISNGNLLDAILTQVPVATSFDQLRDMDLRLRGSLHTFSIKSVPQLQHLRVLFNDSDCHIAFPSTPSLTDLTWMQIRFPSKVFNGISWSNITEFISDRCEYERNELHTVLDCMTNLKSLWFVGETQTDLYTKLPQLEQLQLDGYDGVCNAMNFLVTPQLEYLYLQDEFDPSEAVELIRRSGCTLEMLTLYGSSIAEGWMAPEFGKIDTFHWKNPSDIANGIARLTLQKSPGIENFIPQLTTLFMTDIIFHSDEEYYESVEVVDDLIAMLKSRLPEVHQSPNGISTTTGGLTYVKITFASDIHDDSVRKLEEFMESELVERSGANVDIQCYGDSDSE